MLTILSQSTSDTNRDRAYAALRGRYPNWESVRAAPRDDLEETIRPAGLFKQKARVLQETLDTIVEREGALDLARLRNKSDAEVIDYLTSIRGVGVKTAACVLCFSLRRPYLPVDTHVHRLAKRLGLIAPTTTADQAHQILNREGAVPSEVRFDFHIQLIRHGRTVCRASRPDCSLCVLEELCPREGVHAGSDR
jgi:endonuclease-3